jgi:transcriptional regulator with XRE-family HTH domain
MLIVPNGTMKLKTARDLGKAIRTARKGAGLTLEQCAGVSGVGVRFLSELERGKDGAQLGLALRVAASLGIALTAELPRR